MGTGFRATLGGLALLLVAGTAAAQSWQYQQQNRAATVRSADGSTYLVMACLQSGALWMTVEFLNGLAGWRANQPVHLEVDGRVFPVPALDGGSDNVALHTREDGGSGPSEHFLGALASGSIVEIGGPAAEAMAAGARRYSLRGSSTALTRLRGECQPPAQRIAGHLTSGEIIEMIGRPMRIRFRNSVEDLMLHPDGRLQRQVAMPGVNWQGPVLLGHYEIETDGCVRIRQDGAGLLPCYRFAGAGGALRVHQDMPVDEGSVEFPSDSPFAP